MAVPSTTPAWFTQLRGTIKQDVLPILGRLPAYGRLVYTLTTTVELSAAEKSALLIALGYQLSPVDLIPGFIPVIGQLDDLLVLFWGIRRTLRMLPQERASALLKSVGLSPTLLDDDTRTVRRALRSVLASGARVAEKGAGYLLSSALTGATYLGYLTYYTIKARKK